MTLLHAAIRRLLLPMLLCTLAHASALAQEAVVPEEEQSMREVIEVRQRTEQLIRERESSTAQAPTAGTTPMAICRASDSSRTWSHPLSNLPFHLAIHSWGT